MEPKPRTKQDDYHEEFTEEELAEIRRRYTESKANPLTLEDIERGKQRWLEIVGEDNDE